MAQSPALKDLHEKIASQHRLAGGKKEYFRRFNALHGGDLEIALSAGTTGKVPEGFGAFFEWDRDVFEEVSLSVFINAADPLGVLIAGAKAEDRITVTSASGLASFDEADGSIIPSIVGLVGAVAVSGSTAGAAAGGGADTVVPTSEEAKGIVAAATKFAEEVFKSDDVHKMRRDPFGHDPGTDKFARREGGVLICLPLAGGPYYSGVDEKFILKSDAPRSDSQKPAHVEFGFFLIRGDTNHMSRRVGGDGEIYLIAWDHRFDDNAGFYHVRLKLRRG